VITARTVAVFAAVLVLAGCGSSPKENSAAPTPSTTAASATDAPAVDEAPDDGEMTASYEAATTPEAQNGRKIMEQAELLEALAATVNETFNLPHDVRLLGQQCDDPNAFWDPSEQAVVLCYEDADFAETVFAADGDPDPVDAALNAEIGSFFHELGHMLIDLYDLPITGREEDVADQLAAFVLLAENDDGSVDSEAVKAVRDFAGEFRAFADQEGEVGESQFAGGHSLNQTRMYNLLCWAYGADPEAHASIVDDGELPQDRAELCEDEYVKMQHGWATLLDPYVK
jgi:outer membrane murein-binding lipoprotein Lpp